MFTLDQIKTAHQKVKTGADFPAYIKEIRQLGVTSYETFVSDGHTNYLGTDDYQTSSPAKYDTLQVSETSNKEQFQSDLLTHQKGKTDFLTFCNDSATSGIEKWIVRMDKMTCTYYDKAGNELLVEGVPQM